MVSISCIFLTFLQFRPIPFIRGYHRVHWASKFQEDTFLVFSVKSHSIWSTRKKRENPGLGECCAKFESIELRNLLIEGARSGKKVKVNQNLPYRPLDVRCLTDCGGKEPLLATFVMGLSGVSANGCQQFSADPMVHCNSGFCKHGAPCLDMSKAFLPCRFAGEDTFT